METQREVDVKNLRFYAQMAKEFNWRTDVIHQSVVVQTLQEIAARIEKLTQEVNTAPNSHPQDGGPKEIAWEETNETR
jgi:hypothetical protein